MQVTAAHHADPVPLVRRIGIGDLFEALRRGWDDFMAMPTQLVFLSLLYPVIGIIAARAMMNEKLIPLLFPLAAGFTLLGPVLALGMYELSRRRERGEPTSFYHAFAVLRSPAMFAIVSLGALLLAIFVVWIASAKVIYDLTLGTLGPMAPDALLQAVFTTAEGRRMLVIGNLVGLGFALLVLALTAVSFPLMVDRQVGPAVAARTSLRAFAENPGPMVAWGLIVAVVLTLGMLPIFVGLAVALPVLGHATWHLYRRLVVS
jgi:uncharacterized membrane protein